MMSRLYAFVLLMAAWLAWSGLFKPLLISLGVVSCIIVLILADRMRFHDRDLRFLAVLHRLPAYWVWLTIEMIKSNIDVVRIVLSPRPDISPTVVTLEALAQSDLGRVTLGNSITLTPGTVTIDLQDGRLTVHCLTRAGATQLAGGEMNRRVAALIG
jgi:multicomponent Na+:H+ antiporter subunit E